jgi:hypothetical protein
MNKSIFRKTDLSWIVDYDYDRSGCTCNDWPCRCTTIENTRINKVNAREVVKELYDRLSRTADDGDKYCFDRICYAFNVYDKYLYEVETCGGYYGEEIRGVWFENEEKVFDAYYEMLELKTPLEKIQYCLKLEYGYLLDCVESATSADIIEVSTDKIRPPQKEYFIKVDKSVIEEYKNRELPIAVCIMDGDKYRLIDGYHRFVANKDKDRVKIIVLK